MEVQSSYYSGNSICQGPLKKVSVAASQQKVCYDYQNGRCYRKYCHFLHIKTPDSSSNVHRNPQAPGRENPGHYGSLKWERGRGIVNENDVQTATPKTPEITKENGVQTAAPKTPKNACKYWMKGNCVYGERCRYLHSWFMGEDFTILKSLDEHHKTVTGIGFPEGSDKLYSASKDESLRAWDCHTGKCAGVINVEGEVGCMITEGPWIFVGVPNAVKAWNLEANTELSLSGPAGQVYALVVGNNMLFAGTQDGSILVWKSNDVGSSLGPTTSMPGHCHAVVSLTVAGDKLYSGSMDNTIKVWDLGTLQCVQTLTGHTSVVMSLLCAEQFLFSCSLDKTIRVWAPTEKGPLEVVYTHTEEHGVLSLCGMQDSQEKPVLLCACNDNAVRLYDMPSFAERGRIFTKEEVRCILKGPGGLFFTGDGSGQLKVWKWLTKDGSTPAPDA